MTAAPPALAPILHAKFLRPRLPDTFVPRPRLIEQLDRGLAGPLTLICASAGFGKTTLASSWIAELERNATRDAFVPAAWLSLDAGDNDLFVFVRYLIAALQTIFPDACADTSALLKAPRAVPLGELFSTLSNELSSLPQRFILTLDEYEAIHEQPVHDLLHMLAQHWPRPLHLVLISRRNPPLPLADLRAKGLLTELRTHDLRFTADETAAFVRSSVPTALSDAVVQKLDWLNEGWIAGLQVAGMSMRRTGNADDALAALSGSKRDLSDFLAEEILAPQPRPMQTFMIKTSILDSFCASLCDAVAGEVGCEHTAQEHLTTLERANLFVTVLDEHRQWYRYHALFRDMLQTRLAQTLEAGEIADLHRRAAHWLAQRGLVDDALRHALAARDLDLAAGIIENEWRAVLNREDRPTLERWLALLPDELVQSRPKLLMMKAWELHLSWRLEAQAAARERVRALIDGDSGLAQSTADLADMRGNVATLSALSEYFGGHIERSLASAREALDLLPVQSTYARAGAMLFLGVSMQARGEGAAAERLLAAQYEALSDKTSVFALRLLLTQCFVCLLSGQLEKVRQFALVMGEQARRSQLPILESWSPCFSGIVSYEQNDLIAAERDFVQVVDRRYMAQIITLRDAMSGLALVQQSAGRSPEALDTLNALSALDLQQRGQVDDRTSALRAHLLLQHGDEDHALRWATSYNEPLGDRPLIWLEEPQVTKARIVTMAGGQVAQALEALAALRDLAAHTHNVRLMIQIQALRSVALEAAGEPAAAEGALREAVALAAPGGFVRAFVELGPRLQAILRRIAAAPAGDHAHRLLAALTAGHPAASGAHDSAQAPRRAPVSGPPPIDPLSRRELDVLVLLSQPLSNKEIAARLGISYLTVKRHLVEIYSKLGVENRWDAVAKATELGILPPR